MKNNLSIECSTTRAVTKRLRRGFSFTEVLFAVMILGIGFIMIAGIFPVAISQSQTTADETMSATIARGAAEHVAKMGYGLSLLRTPLPNQVDTNPPSDNQVHPFWDQQVLIGTTITTSLWEQMRGNLVLSEDPRYAFVPFWRRPNDVNLKPASYVQLIVVAVRSRNRQNYVPSFNRDPNNGPIGDFAFSPDPNTATLMGRSVGVQFLPNNSADLPDRIRLTGGPSETDAVAPGMFVIIADDQTFSHPANQPADPSKPSANGWVLRLGNRDDNDSTGKVWELQPGADLKNVPTFNGYPNGYRPDSGTALIVGQALQDPSRRYQPDPTAGDYNPYEGGTQDITAYSTFVKIR